jgi:hypothetical protein
MSTLAEYVQAGVRLLDEKQPDWRSKVNVGSFSVVHRDLCVLGQVFGWYGTGLKALGLSRRGEWTDDDLGAPYGFSIAGWGSNAEWEELQTLWEQELQQ